MAKKIDFSASYSNINKYVDQLYNGFVPAVTGKMRTLKYVNVHEDVKYAKEIPTVATALTLKPSTSCTTFANGATTSIAGVGLTVQAMYFQESMCLEELEQYWAGQYMKRGSDQDSLPFESLWVDEKSRQVAKAADILFWQGGTITDGAGGTVTMVGIISRAIAGGAAGTTAGSFAVSTGATNGVIKIFDDMVSDLSTDVLDQDDLILWCSREAFTAYTQSIRNLNFYHFSPEEISQGETKLFGYDNIRLVTTVGLNGYAYALLGRASFINYGTDLTLDKETFQTWYDPNSNTYRMRLRFKQGGALSFPSTFAYATSNNS
jgi:hypothetical protein